MEEFQLLVSAIEKAQQKGVYSLQEVQSILNAIGQIAAELQKAKAVEAEPEEKPVLKMEKK